MRFAILFSLLLLAAVLVGCSKEKTNEQLTPTCEFESLGWGCSAEKTSDGIAITIRNNLGITAGNVGLALEYEPCQQRQDAGTIAIERSSTLVFRCANVPEEASLHLDYTLPSAFAGDPPRFTKGVLTVS
jgi:hypothetical protein